MTISYKGSVDLRVDEAHLRVCGVCVEKFNPHGEVLAVCPTCGAQTVSVRVGNQPEKEADQG